MTRAPLLRALVAASTLAAAQGCGAHAPPQVVGEEGSYLFDTVRGGPGMHVFRWTNSGGSTTEPLAVTLTGDVDSFQLTADDCNGRTLRGGGSCDVTVQLANDVEGLYSAQLHVQDPAEKSIPSCLLSGKVGPAALEATADPQTGVVQGQSGTARVVFTNVGGARTATLSSSISSGFSLVGDGCSGATLAGGQSCTISVGYSASLDDGGIHQAHVAVSGGLLKAETDLAFTVAPATTLLFTNTDFGPLDPLVGGTLAVKVKNQGTALTQPLEILLRNDPTSPVSYHVSYDGCHGVQLVSGGSCTINLGVQPTGTWQAGTRYSATVIVSASNIPPSEATVAFLALDNHAALYLTFTGNGGGEVVTTPTGSVFCSTSSCPPVVYLLAGAPITLFANADTGSNFVGWAGICSGGSSCTFTPQKNVDLHLQAQFSH